MNKIVFCISVILALPVAASRSWAEKAPPGAAIEASPFMFSPNGDGDLDTTDLQLKLSGDYKLRAWQIYIQNTAGETVRKMSWPDETPASVKWDGKDSEDQELPDGRYSAFFEAHFSKKLVITSSAPIIIDRAGPIVSIEVSPEIISPDGDGKDDGAVFSVSAQDLTFVERWSLEISDEKDTPVKLFEGKGAAPESITWDGKDDYYSRVVPNGIYTAELTASDVLRNKSIPAKVKIRVHVPPKVVTKEIKIQDDVRGLKVNLSSNILFGSGKAKLQSSANKSLDEVAALAKAYPENKISIEGHSDSVGSNAYNNTLSLERAQSIRDYLVSKGLPKGRFMVSGYGEEKPIASNRNREGQMKNRRVEIIILKSGKE
ncbi:MAG: OmpA family protein [Candidatus Omnitrophica bacterium]|nr:OmpA family protein [Candidatus Omnitrophota bacterium]